MDIPMSVQMAEDNLNLSKIYFLFKTILSVFVELKNEMIYVFENVFCKTQAVIKTGHIVCIVKTFYVLNSVIINIYFQPLSFTLCNM